MFLDSTNAKTLSNRKSVSVFFFGVFFKELRKREQSQERKMQNSSLGWIKI